MERTSLLWRERELDRLKTMLHARKSFLLYGPVGVGKTVLISSAVVGFPNMLVCTACSSVKNFFVQLVAALAERKEKSVVGSLGSTSLVAVKSKSTVALKGIAARALVSHSHTVILDQLGFVSHTFATAIRHFSSETNTPIVAIGRSVHMEDIGFIANMFPDKSERMEIKNFDSACATEFATGVVNKYGIHADNLQEVIHKIVEFSDGNPGAMLWMAQMASKRSTGQIRCR